MRKLYSKRAKWVNCYLSLPWWAGRLIRKVKNLIFFVTMQLSIYLIHVCGTPASRRTTRESASDKMASLNKSEHRSCVLIIIIGYRRLARSIFDVLVCDDLDIVLNCKTLKSRFRKRQRKDNKGDRHSYPDATEDQKLPILPEKENVPPTGTFVYCKSKSTWYLQISVEIRTWNFCLITNYVQLAYIYYR